MVTPLNFKTIFDHCLFFFNHHNNFFTRVIYFIYIIQRTHGNNEAREHVSNYCTVHHSLLLLLLHLFCSCQWQWQWQWQRQPAPVQTICFRWATGQKPTPFHGRNLTARLFPVNHLTDSPMAVFLLII